MRSRRLLATLAILLCGILASTQSRAQGSPYDNLGFGRPIEAWNAHIDALSGAGVALTDPRIVNGPNPASWSWLTRARLETELHFDITQSTQQNFPTAKNQDLHLGGFVFASPVWDKYRLGLALGFRPLTDALATSSTSDSTQNNSYRSQGGASEAFLGIAGQPIQGIALAAEIDVLFGNVRHLSQVSFTDATAATSNFERDYALSGLRGTFGLLFSGDSIAQALHGVSFGAVFTTPSSLKTAIRTVITPVTSTLDTELSTSSNGYYPGSVTLGLGFRVGARYNIVADYALQDFSTSYLSSDQFATGDPSLGASTRYSIGVERLPAIGNEYGSLGFWDRLGLRLGASYYQMPFRPAGSTGVNALAGSFGLGIPISLESLIDLSFTAGTRAPVIANTTPSDLFFRIGATISLSERWFVPTRTDD